MKALNSITGATDKKITDLTAVTLPLAGTEVLPIVQSGTNDKITATQLWTGVTRSYATPSTWWKHANHITATAAGTPLTGVLFLTPFDTGPGGFTTSNIGVWCNTAVALAGGATATYTVAVYKDNGTGGYPNLVGGPVASTTVTAGSTGVRTAAFSQTFAPGWYWYAFLYVSTGTVNTQAAFTCISGSTPLALSSSASLGTVQRYFTASSISSMPTTAITLGSGSGGTCPVVALQAA